MSTDVRFCHLKTVPALKVLRGIYTNTISGIRLSNFFTEALPS